MKNFKNVTKRKNKGKRGAALVEYGMVAGLVALAGIGSVMLVGERTERTFCEASTAIGRIIYDDPTLNCDPETAVGDEPIVIPTLTQLNFEDVLYPNATTGLQNVLVTLSEPLSEDITLTTTISSQNPYQSRTVAACYAVASAEEPVCSDSNTSTSILVPSNATAMGYRVDVEQDTNMPWENIVYIDLPNENYGVNVDREEAPPFIDGIALDLPDHTFEPEMTGWQYGTFATLEGEFNRHLEFFVAKNDNDFTYRSCYIQNEGGTPSCGVAATSGGEPVLVPPGAQELGYSVYLPDEDIKPDWVAGLDYEISYDESTLVQDSLVVTRLNSDAMYGAINTMFTDPYTYEETDQAWTYGEFIDIEGPRNTTLSFSMVPTGGETVNTAACYKTSETATPSCGQISSGTSSIDIPTRAMQIGYRVYLPDAGPAYSAWSTTHNFTVQGGNSILFNQEVDIVRPNPDFIPGMPWPGFSDPYVFEETDEMWTDGEFVAITGGRNTPVTFSLATAGGETITKYACYKNTATATPNCGAASSGTATVEVPTTAEMVGYRMYLPDEGPSTTDWSTTQTFTVVSEGEELFNQTAEVVRPNPDYDVGTVTASFSDPYEFQETDEAWTYGEYIAIDGPRNTPVTLSVAHAGGESPNKYACYKNHATSTPVCGSTSYGTASVDVPTSAQFITYRMYLPDEGPSTTDWSTTLTFTVEGNGQTVFTQTAEVVRPNADYDVGTVTASFSDPYNYQETDETWTDGEFISIDGPRNTSVTLTSTYVSGESVTKTACYKNHATSTPICGNNSTGTSTVDVPTSAQFIGYKMYLPDEGPSTTDWSTTQTLTVAGNGQTVFTQTAEVVRPNPDYDVGAVTARFSDPYEFQETDEAWTYGEYIAIDGPRNTPVTLSVAQAGGESPLKYACYKNNATSTPICGSTSSGTASVDVPTSAQFITYRISLPSEGPSSTDWSTTQTFTVEGNGQTVFTQTADIVRPNPDFEVGSITSSFSNPYEFQETDEKWTEGEFIAINGPRNTTVTLQMIRLSGESVSRSVCYKTSAGANPNCSSGSTGSPTVDIPTSATHIGYKMYLPDAAASDTDWSTTQQFNVSGNGSTFFTQNAEIVRPNPDYLVAGTTQNFSSVYNYDSTNKGWTSGEFINLDGPRNTDMTFTVQRLSGDTGYKTACYKNTVSATPICGPSNGGTASVQVPATAVQIGFRNYLPNNTTSWSSSQRYNLSFDGTSYFTQDATVNRPN